MIANTTTATRYYFGTLKLALNQVKLSVSESDKPLSHDLQMVKKKLGLTLITFEDANIDLEPFIRVHPFETVNFLTHAVLHHYQDELLSQAVLILGNILFLFTATVLKSLTIPKALSRNLPRNTFDF